MQTEIIGYTRSFAITMIELARNSCYRDDFEVKVDGNVYAFDSSTIDLCLSIFWWAKFRENKGGIKFIRYLM